MGVPSIGHPIWCTHAGISTLLCNCAPSRYCVVVQQCASMEHVARHTRTDCSCWSLSSSCACSCCTLGLKHMPLASCACSRLACSPLHITPQLFMAGSQEPQQQFASLCEAANTAEPQLTLVLLIRRLITAEKANAECGKVVKAPSATLSDDRTVDP